MHIHAYKKKKIIEMTVVNICERHYPRANNKFALKPEIKAVLMNLVVLITKNQEFLNYYLPASLQQN